MRLLLHTQDHPEGQALDLDDGRTFADALGLAADEFVFSVDIDEPLGVDQLLESMNLQNLRCVRTRCKRVEVEVTFNGQTVQRRFVGAKSVAKVFEWATSKKGFGLDPTDAAEHELVLAGTTDAADPLAPIAAYAKPRECSVDLDLVPKERIEG